MRLEEASLLCMALRAQKEKQKEKNRNKKQQAPLKFGMI